MMYFKSYPIDRIEIEEAHHRIKPFIHKTPILRSDSIDKIAGCEVFFKCENFQKVGAFKMRGASNALLQLDAKKLERGVITHSSGNHAQAVAKAAEQLNTKAYIVMPKNAPKVKVEAVKAYEGIIHFCEPTLQAREDTTRSLIEQNGATFIHPYDHRDTICGQATAAKEVFEEFNEIDALICPVGGGGLLAGSTLASNYFSKGTLVYGAEPEGADDAYRSFNEHRLIPQTNPNTIADGLLTSLGKLNFRIINQGVKGILLVSDREIIDAMRLIWERMKILIEPSAAVPVASIFKNKVLFESKRICIILSGGNLDLDSYFNLID